LKTYVVGGAVRDELLGLPVRDRDHVVVGATPKEMVNAGFRAVGADFPVFLHPETQEEYALARTERKTAPGYRGFAFHASPEVTLEEDLRRRDLTINAMARAEDGSLVDPYGGERDLRAGILRHVGEAFAEDPVRILRVARFAARFGFRIAPETLALMRRMAASGEVDALVPERVWAEMARGLMELEPSRMLEALRACGALARILPELGQTGEAALAARLDIGARRDAPLPVRFALLTLDLDPPAIVELARRINAPGEARELALLAARERRSIPEACEAGPEEQLGILERVDAVRRPDRLEHLLLAIDCAAAAAGRSTAAAAACLREALARIRGVDAAALARAQPGDIPGAIRRARLQALSRP
jgi:tRNA nucleotidyltransferase (CCA-adding enzyme)